MEKFTTYDRIAFCCVYYQHCTKHFNTGTSQLFGVMEGRKVTDNPKPWLRQKQSKHDTK
jgi:hypothetical protein